MQRNRVALRCLFIITMMVLSHISLAGFQTPIVVSPDGRTIAVPRDRVVYLVDAATLVVQQRVWVGGVVKDLGFAADGASLYIRDDAGRVLALPKEAAEPTIVVRGITFGKLAMNPRAGLIAMFAKGTENRLSILNIGDGSERAAFPLPDDWDPADIVIEDSGTQVVVFSRRIKRPMENEGQTVAPEESTSRVEKAAFKEKYDGHGSDMLIFDLTGKYEPRDIPLWVEVNQGDIKGVVKDSILIFRFNNPCLRIALADGDVEMFMTPMFSNHGIGLSPDGRSYLVGSLAQFAYVKPDSTPVEVELSRDQRLPGWPEYFHGFAITAKGMGYGWTSAGRLAKIRADGQLLQIVPIF